MGLYDRDYYRDDDAGTWSEWVNTRGVAVLIGITSAVFLIQLFSTPPGANRVRALEAINPGNYREEYPELRPNLTDGVQRNGDLYLPAMFRGEVWRPLTAFWVHESSGLFHVLLSMLFLYFLGKPLEERLGGREIIALYIASGVFVMLGEFLGKLADSASGGKLSWLFDATFPAHGSSGPLMALIVVYGLRFWNETVRFFGALTMTAQMAAGIIIAVSLLVSLVGPNVSDRLAMSLLGIAAGAGYHRLGVRISDGFSGWSFRRKPRLKTYAPPEVDAMDDEPADPPVYRTPSPRTREAGTVVDEQLEAKLDRVLDKVAKLGKDSLTAEEQKILLRASEVYKRRRESH